MAIENWIDDLTNLWGTVESHRSGNVKSYSVLNKKEIPEDVTVFPSVITPSFELVPTYARAGSFDLWRGISEFHLFEDTSKKHYPDIMKYFNRIKVVAASSIQLGGKVASVLIDTKSGPGIVGPSVLQWGTEAPHLGLVVTWIVKETVSVAVDP